MPVKDNMMRKILYILAIASLAVSCTVKVGDSEGMFPDYSDVTILILQIIKTMALLVLRFQRNGLIFQISNIGS